MKSDYADILNDLADMQDSPYYATAKTRLERAESTIVHLESELADYKAQAIRQGERLLTLQHICEAGKLEGWEHLPIKTVLTLLDAAPLAAQPLAH